MEICRKLDMLMIAPPPFDSPERVVDVATSSAAAVVALYAEKHVCPSALCPQYQAVEAVWPP